MVSENRMLYFDQEDLANAAYAFCQRHGKSLPAGKLTAVLPEAEEQEAVRLCFNNKEGEGHEVRLTYVEMTAAMIMYCGARDIPLPRTSRKRLTPAGEGMILTIRVGELPRDGARTALRGGR